MDLRARLFRRATTRSGSPKNQASCQRREEEWCSERQHSMRAEGGEGGGHVAHAIRSSSSTAVSVSAASVAAPAVNGLPIDDA